MHDDLNEVQQDVLTRLLLPLKKKRQVSLVVNDIRLPKKTRKYPTMLVITPYEGKNCPPGYFLFAMPPYGSEILNMEDDLKPFNLARLGLSMTLATALAKALRYVLLGEQF